MQLTYLDWFWIALYFLINGAIGLYYKSRAGTDVNEFFLSGRNIPWWLAGTSMVATTFAADTPLAVTGMVARGGIAGNWLWWNFVASSKELIDSASARWQERGFPAVPGESEFIPLPEQPRPAATLL